MCNLPVNCRQNKLKMFCLSEITFRSVGVCICVVIYVFSEEKVIHCVYQRKTYMYIPFLNLEIKFVSLPIVCKERLSDMNLISYLSNFFVKHIACKQRQKTQTKLSHFMERKIRVRVGPTVHNNMIYK